MGPTRAPEVVVWDVPQGHVYDCSVGANRVNGLVIANVLEGCALQDQITVKAGPKSQPGFLESMSCIVLRVLHGAVLAPGPDLMLYTVVRWKASRYHKRHLVLSIGVDEPIKVEMRGLPHVRRDRD